MSFRIDRGQIIPGSVDGKKPSIDKNAPDFQNMLHEAINKNNEVKISAHAQQRMNERNIVLSKDDMKSIQDAMKSLDEKGAKESLMLYKDHAFIASIRNRTIITSMDSNEMDIVTNIDSTMIVR